MKDKFEEIYKDNYINVYKYVYSKLKMFDIEDCTEDVVQEVFVTLLENDKKINLKYSIKNNMYIIAKGKCSNYIKKKCRRNDIENSKLNFKYIYENDPENIIVQNEKENVLLKSINRLSTYDKRLIFLAENQEMKYKDIGKLLNKSENTIKVQVFRIKKKLKKIILEELKYDNLNNNSISKIILLIIITSIGISGFVYAIKKTINMYKNYNQSVYVEDLNKNEKVNDNNTIKVEESIYEFLDILGYKREKMMDIDAITNTIDNIDRIIIQTKNYYFEIDKHTFEVIKFSLCNPFDKEMLVFKSDIDKIFPMINKYEMVSKKLVTKDLYQIEYNYQEINIVCKITILYNNNSNRLENYYFVRKIIENDFLDAVQDVENDRVLLRDLESIQNNYNQKINETMRINNKQMYFIERNIPNENSLIYIDLQTGEEVYF